MNAFAKAHKMTKSIIQKGDSYSATFAECLKLVYKIEKGSKLWEKEGFSRLYFASWRLKEAFGLQTTHYKTGAISSALMDGESISNTKARRICSQLESGKLWFDNNSLQFNWKHIDDAIAQKIVNHL